MIPFAAGTAMTGAVLTMILPPRGGPATPEGRALRRSAGGRGNLLSMYRPAGSVSDKKVLFTVWCPF